MHRLKGRRQDAELDQQASYKGKVYYLLVVLWMYEDLLETAVLLPGTLALPPNHSRPHVVESTLALLVLEEAMTGGDNPLRGKNSCAADEPAIPIHRHGVGPAVLVRYVSANNSVARVNRQAVSVVLDPSVGHERESPQK